MDHALRLNARIAEALVIRPPKNMIVKKKHSALNSLSRWSVWGYTSWGVPGGVASVVEVVDHPLSEMYHPAHGRLDLLGAANGGRTRKPCDVYVGVSSPSWPTDTSSRSHTPRAGRKRCSLCKLHPPVGQTIRTHLQRRYQEVVYQRIVCTSAQIMCKRAARDFASTLESIGNAVLDVVDVLSCRTSSDRSTKHGTFTVSLRRTAWTQSVTRGSWRLPLTVATGTKMAMVSAIAAALAAFAAAAAAAAATATVELFCHPKKVQHLNNRLL